MTFVGLTKSDDTLIPPIDAEAAPGVPIIQRTNGTGFSLVIEGAPGASGVAVGHTTYFEGPTIAADLQIQVDHPLGNGSTAVCDRTGTSAGGVPAIDPPTFDNLDDTLVGTMNDLSCRFLDGSGSPAGRPNREACVKFLPSEEYGFVSADSTLQFCGFVDSITRFGTGDTLVSVRLRDEDGNWGPPAQFVVRIGAP